MALDLIFSSWASPSSSSQIWHQGAALVSSTRHPLGLKVSIHSCLNAVAFGLSRYPISLFVAQRAFTLRYKTCGSLQCYSKATGADLNLLVVPPFYRISRIAGGVSSGFCYFVISCYLVILLGIVFAILPTFVGQGSYVSQAVRVSTRKVVFHPKWAVDPNQTPAGP